MLVTELGIQFDPLVGQKAERVMTEPRDHVLPSERATAAPSQPRVVLQVLLIIVGVAFGLWALHRVASVVRLRSSKQSTRTARCTSNKRGIFRENGIATDSPR